MLKKIIVKLERENIMMWLLMWLNWSIEIINDTFQLLDIYIYIYRFTSFVLALHFLLLNFLFCSICCINCSAVNLFILLTVLTIYCDYIKCVLPQHFAAAYFCCNSQSTITTPYIYHQDYRLIIHDKFEDRFTTVTH